VLCEPLTGRTHQLRVHFAGLGCPILGDDLYGEPSPLIGRHALHSARLTFPRPSDGERITVRADLPSDMREAADALGLCRIPVEG
jgi:23S rRNA pseudouridine1911/1915/1917 synthase